MHLQCHIGTDTISLARLGARMTGLDFSAGRVEEAGALSASRRDVDFVEADVYGAAEVLAERRSTSSSPASARCAGCPTYAAGPRWSQAARPGGRLFIREGHPVLWALDDPRPDGLLVLSYPYFERDEPMVFDEAGTYVETDVEFEHNITHEWNHGLGEIVTALLDAGLASPG